MAEFIGTSHGDEQAGTEDDDTFDFSQGGKDKLLGLGGNDTFVLGLTFTAQDRIWGGSGFDTLVLNQFGFHVTLGDKTLIGIERIEFAGGNDYELTLAEETVLPGESLTVDASALSSVTISKLLAGNAQGHVEFIGGAGNDTVFGGAHGNTISAGDGIDIIRVLNGFASDVIDGGAANDDIQARSNDVISGGDGEDQIVVFELGGGLFSHVLGLYGGEGDDTVILQPSVDGSFVITPGSLDGGAGFDTIFFGRTTVLDLAGFSASDSGFEQVSGEVHGTAARNVLDFSDFTASDLAVSGEGGDDKLISAKKSDTVLNGGDGADTLIGGKAVDVLVYAAASESTGKHHDKVAGFDALHDFFNMLARPVAVDTPITSGDLSRSSFDTDLAALSIAARHAVLFTPDGGTLAGQTFLLVDENGVAGYQAHEDFVINLAHAANMAAFDEDNFL